MTRKNQAPTHYEEVLQYLLKYGTITAMEGFNKLWIVDLAGVIRDIRKNYRIDDEWIHKTNFWGRPIKYKKYIYVGPKGK